MLSPNKRPRLDSPSSDSGISGAGMDDLAQDDSELDEADLLMDISQDSSREEETDAEDDEESQRSADIPDNLRLPIVYPRRRYVGACNVRTVKDGERDFSLLRARTLNLFPVNFVGPRDEYVVSGSDDGWLPGT
jgi:hypothetical protein